MPTPLEGIKVIEMGTFGPANIAAQWLGDLGADVIMVEPPANRALGPEWRKRRDTGLLGVANNRNKQSIVLNLRMEEARAILHQLVRNADVLIEANRPGISKRLGFDYETLQPINPRLVYCSLTGYGQRGPYVQIPGHGLAWAATGGWLLMQGQGLANMGGDYTGKPWTNPLVQAMMAARAEGNLPDIKATTTVVVGILAALLARGRTGLGQYLDMAIFDTVIAARRPEHPPKGREDLFESDTPEWNIYECRDGKYVAVAAIEEIQWGNLCKGLGVPELAEERGAEGQRAQEIIEIFGRIFKTRTRDEWFESLSVLDNEIAKVNSIDEAMEDPQVKTRGMHVEVVGSDGARGIQYGTPIKLSKTPARSSHTAAPRFGEHTSKLLAELGYKEADISRLREAGAVV